MLRALTDKLNNTNRAVTRVQREHPGEEIVFASAATILETEKTAPPTGWSFRRFFQRRGGIVITRRRLILRSNFVSAITAMHVITIVLLLVAVFRDRDSLAYRDFMALILVAALCILLLQRLPYQREIDFADIEDIKVRMVRGMAAKGSLLTLYVKDRAINVVPAQLLSEEVIRTISSGGHA